ncbi:MAG: carboxypeptidase-like regulatory domain-containing protein [Euryarchaeota archaeon]|nr:carboxypeptidase-like regulatory domain-containing protein [Euryarchaeota archaeon]
MNIFENISNGYKRIATGIAIVSFLAILYFSMLPGASLAAPGGVYAASGEGIGGAIVKLVAWPQYTATTSDGSGGVPIGEYTIPEVPEGTYFITASKEGYTTNLSTVTVTGLTTVTRNFTLTPGYNWYFAEGSISDATDAYVQLSNPGNTPVNVDVRFMLTDGTVVTNSSVLPANTTGVVDAKTVLPTPSYFAINVLSDNKIGAERTMVFSAMNWGGKIVDDVHDTVGVAELNTTWYFAEGSITPDTYAYIQILNPNAYQANVTVQYMKTDGSVVTTSKVVTATSRDYFDPRSVLSVPSYFSVKVTSDIPIMSERTMVFVNMNWGGKIINGLHDTIGSPELSRTWYFAEGSITSDTFAYIQILNPNPDPATVTVEYMKTDGTVVTTSKVVGRTSRDYFDPRTNLTPLPQYFSVKVTSDIPIMSERTMVFANMNWGGKIINGFHDTIGSTRLNNTWSLGGGRVDTDIWSYVQILNPNSEAAHLDVKFMLTDGTVIPLTKTVTANSRDFIDVRSVLGPSQYGWYSVQVTSVDQPIFIEKTEVWAGVTWHGRYIDGFGDTVGSIV